MSFIGMREVSRQGNSPGLSWFATELISIGTSHRANYSCPETSEGSEWGYWFSPFIFLERKQDIKNKTEIHTCRWCYESYENLKLEKHKECKSRYKKTMRARKQNLELVNTRVDKFSSPKFNKNPYLSEEKNMEILMAYYQLGHIKKDPRTNY